MLSSSGVRCAVLVSAVLFPAVASAGQTCVASGSQPLIAASVNAPARVYFRSDVAKADHYVDMHVAGTKSWAVLPRVNEGTQFIEYRVVTGSAKSQKVVTSGRITVANNCAAAKLDDNQRSAASGLIVGATAEGPALPAGFRCEGVVGQINAKGELRSYKPCQQIALQQAATAAEANAAVTKSASSNKSSGKTAVVADATLRPGTTRSFAPTRKSSTNPGPNPTPRQNHPYSRSRP